VNQEGSASELFNGSRKWIASVFKSANNVIQAESESGGYIIVKGLSNLTITSTFKNTTVSSEVPMYFTLSLDFKDNRYRYSFSDIYFAPRVMGSETTTPIEYYNISNPDIGKVLLKEFEET